MAPRCSPELEMPPLSLPHSWHPTGQQAILILCRNASVEETFPLPRSDSVFRPTPPASAVTGSLHPDSFPFTLVSRCQSGLSHKTRLTTLCLKIVAGGLPAVFLLSPEFFSSRGLHPGQSHSSPPLRNLSHHLVRISLVLLRVPWASSMSL